MNHVTKLYVQVFFKYGVLLAGIISVSRIFSDKSIGLWDILFFFVFCGIFMSLGLTTRHLKKLKNLGINKLNKESLSPYQHEEFDVNSEKENLIQRLKNDEMTKKMDICVKESSITLNTKPLLKFFGQEIQIEIKKIENGVNRIFVSSKPNSPTVLLDFGKNRENLNMIRRVLLN